jgi:hydrogenase-4 membrane subunit HyfE
MPEISLPIIYLLESIVFLTVVFLHLMKRSTSAVIAYIVQSTAVAILLIMFSFGKPSILMAIAIFATITVKIIIAPHFFFDLIRRYRARFLMNTMVNVPLTLLIITALTAFTRTEIFQPLASLSSFGPQVLSLPLAAMLVAIFGIMNRRGAGMQLIGILSLENSIVTFALLAGLEQNPAFQLGITANILMWIVIATVLASLVFRHFGSLDASAMKRLIE